MGFVLTVTTGFVVWIVLWSIGAKSFDAFMITTLIVVTGVTARMLLPHLPGKREQ
jgi:hypothetical protein